MSNDEKLIMNIVRETIGTLEKKNMLKNKGMTPYQKTIKVLKDYNTYKQAIIDKYDKIEEIKEYGLSKRSGSIIGMPSGSRNDATEAEKEQEAIDDLMNSIAITQRYLSLIDKALSNIANDPYSECVKMLYIDGQTLEEVADYFGKDAKTISRNRNKLVEKLSILLFSDETIMELYG